MRTVDGGLSDYATGRKTFRSYYLTIELSNYSTTQPSNYLTTRQTGYNASMHARLKLLWRAGFLAIAVLLFPRAWTTLVTWRQIYSLEASPSQPVAIVLGAGLWRDGSPTPILVDRVATAAQLYFDGKVQTLLFSGDSRSPNYNEPEAMRQYALQIGVPDEVIRLDPAGLRTYDTCYRARHVFGVQSALVVTQRFHLPRAVYLCRTFGIQAQGVIADRRMYPRYSLIFWEIRETLATVVALWEAHVTHPLTPHH